MILQRYTLDGLVRWVVRDAADAAPTALLDRLPAHPQDYTHTGEDALLARLAAGAGTLLAPVSPSKLVCVGLNYRRHAEEMGKPLPTEPLIFLKPSTTVIGPGEAIVLPGASSEVHFEGELAIVIGTRVHRATPAQASAAVLGFTIVNDVTARDLQRRDLRYTRAKGFDTFAPMGPAIATGLDPRSLRITTRVNGEVRQDSGCDDMIFDVATIVSTISQIMTLLPGDVIPTGTPAGVGALRSGDTVSISLSGVGVLENPVVAESAPPG